MSFKILCPFWPRRLGARVGGAADDAAPTRGAFAFRGEFGGELACRLRCLLARQGEVGAEVGAGFCIAAGSGSGSAAPAAGAAALVPSAAAAGILCAGSFTRPSRLGGVALEAAGRHAPHVQARTAAAAARTLAWPSAPPLAAESIGCGSRQAQQQERPARCYKAVFSPCARSTHNPRVTAQFLQTELYFTSHAHEGSQQFLLIRLQMGLLLDASESDFRERSPCSQLNQVVAHWISCPASACK